MTLINVYYLPKAFPTRSADFFYDVVLDVQLGGGRPGQTGIKLVLL